ncbi:MAG: hypothetical protein WCD73_18430 [Pseudolabrys sp.]
MSLEEEGVTLLKFLQTIYRNPEVPLPVRMKAAAIAIEYELPRLAVTATVNSDDFAIQLDRAIERSRMIEAKPITNVTASASASNPTRPQVQVSNGGKPTIVDRRYRRW